jgi:hypothetical protein
LLRNVSVRGERSEQKRLPEKKYSRAMFVAREPTHQPYLLQQEINPTIHPTLGVEICSITGYLFLRTLK